MAQYYKKMSYINNKAKNYFTDSIFIPLHSLPALIFLTLSQKMHFVFSSIMHLNSSSSAYCKGSLFLGNTVLLNQFGVGRIIFQNVLYLIFSNIHPWGIQLLRVGQINFFPTSRIVLTAINFRKTFHKTKQIQLSTYHST